MGRTRLLLQGDGESLDSAGQRVVSSDFTSKGSSWLLCLEEKGGIRETTAIVQARHDGGWDRVVGDSEGHKK